MRSIHRPGVPEVIPEPAAVIVGSHDDSENTGVGGFHIMEGQINTVVGASGVFVLFIVVGIVLYLCHRGLLQACCGACCQACRGFAGPRERHVIQGEGMNLGAGRMPVQVPVPMPAVHWEHAASAPQPARGASIEVFGAIL